MRMETYSDLLNLSLRDTWGSLFNLCRTSERKDTYKLMFLFCTITFGTEQHQMMIRTLLALAFSGRFQELSNPGCDAYNLSKGSTTKDRTFDSAIRQSSDPFVFSPSASLSKAQMARERKTHLNNMKRTWQNRSWSSNAI